MSCWITRTGIAKIWNIWKGSTKGISTSRMSRERNARNSSEKAHWISTPVFNTQSIWLNQRLIK